MQATLDQWRALAAVIDQGGYARAAEYLGRSQSSVSYTIAQLQEAIGVRLLEPSGRRAVLTTSGAELLQRARVLLDGADALQESAQAMAAGGTLEVGLAIEAIYPAERLLPALADFETQFPHLAVELHEPILSGVTDALLDGRAQVAITTAVPPGFFSEVFDTIQFVAVAAAGHHLAQRTSLHLDELRRARQIVVRDSGIHRRLDAGWLGARERWTVSSLATSLAMVSAGLGFAWLPTHMVEEPLRHGTVRPLALTEGGERTVTLNLVRSPVTGGAPAHAALADALRAARQSLPLAGTIYPS